MKSILLSIKPKWVAKIMNRDKLIEVRKNKALYKATKKLIEEQGYATFFMYCTKDNKIFLRDYRDKKKWAVYWRFVAMEKDPSIVGEEPTVLNGKVVAKFTVRKVENIKIDKLFCRTGFTITEKYHTKTLSNNELQKQSCLSNYELDHYLFNYDKWDYDYNGYAYHIEDLVIFDKPRELSSFCKVGCREKLENYIMTCPLEKLLQREMPDEVKQWVITKAPQNFVFVESGE